MKDNEIRYLNAITQAKEMLVNGIITDVDFIKIEKTMAEKNSLNKLSLYRLNDLINKGNRAMYMIQNKEV